MSCLQELKAADCLCRLHYTNWMLNFIRGHSIQALDHFFFSDEAWFHILGLHQCTELPYMEYDKATCLLLVVAALTEGWHVVCSQSGQSYWPNFFQ